MAMKIRTRLFRAVPSIPYVLAILCSILSLALVLPQIWDPVEGAYFYENILDAFMFFLLVCSAFVKRAVRSVLVLISCASIFSTGLLALFERLREFPIPAPSGRDGGPIISDIWFDIVFLGLFFVVAVVEAVMLIRSRADQP